MIGASDTIENESIRIYQKTKKELEKNKNHEVPAEHRRFSGHLKV